MPQYNQQKFCSDYLLDLGLIKNHSLNRSHMKFIADTTETEIFNALMSRETTFTVKCIEFKEKLIVGTVKEREKKARVKAKELVKLINC